MIEHYPYAINAIATIASVIPTQFINDNFSLNKTHAATALNNTMPILFTGIIAEEFPLYTVITLPKNQIEK
jgi:hypothetical protein